MELLVIFLIQYFIQLVQDPPITINAGTHQLTGIINSKATDLLQIANY